MTLTNSNQAGQQDNDYIGEDEKAEDDPSLTEKLKEDVLFAKSFNLPPYNQPGVEGLKDLFEKYGILKFDHLVKDYKLTVLRDLRNNDNSIIPHTRTKMTDPNKHFKEVYMG